jgi:hypothetical protein
MKEQLNINKDLIQYLEKAISLQPSDLKLKDYERGFKAGQLEVISKLRTLFEQQERRNGYA